MATELSQHETLCTAREAKPCPFCGGLPSKQPWHGGGPNKMMVACADDDCDVSPQVTGETLAEALGNWNRRAK